MSKLYLIQTPLAPDTSLEVIPKQVMDVVPTCDLFLVEEIRTARRFVSSLRLGLTIEDLRFEILDKKTKREQIERFFKEFKGKSIGVLSEAGCPGVADPGSLAVQLAHELGWEVIPLVGPSSILLALMASGMNGQSFVFNGYLPIDRPKRIVAIKELEERSIRDKQTQLFIETPYRNNHMLEDLIKQCSPSTMLCVASNVTAPDAFLKTMPIAKWKGVKVDLHKQPTIFVLMG